MKIVFVNNKFKQNINMKNTILCIFFETTLKNKMNTSIFMIKNLKIKEEKN